MQWHVPSSWWVQRCSTSLEDQERVFRNFLRVLFLLDLGVDDAPPDRKYMRKHAAVAK